MKNSGLRSKPGIFLWSLLCPGTEVHGGIALGVDTELVILAGQDGVHEDAHQSCHGQAGHTDGHGADRDNDGAVVADTHSQTQDHGGDEDVAALGEINLIAVVPMSGQAIAALKDYEARKGERR